MNFFDRLYKGYEAEHYIMGKVFDVGYEAFKLSADFGFDIMVTNQKELSLGPNLGKSRKIQPPYALQIKSRRIKHKDIIVAKNDGDRDIYQTYFEIKDDDIQLLIDNDNSFLVCVVFIKDKDGKNTQIIDFWLDSSHIIKLKEKGFLISVSNNKYHLHFEFRKLPITIVKKSLDSLLNKNEITQKAYDELEKILPQRVYKNWNANEYMRVARKSKNGSDELVWKPLPNKLSNIEEIGKSIKLGVF